jgi:hypothetical protein
MKSSSGGVTEVLWIDPAKIQYKIAAVRDLHGSMGGDWDIERRQPFAECAKARAIRERYVEGREWLDTDLFVDAYKRRLERDGRIGRCRTLGELAKEYERRFDKLFARLKQDGFRLDNGKGRKFALPAFLIGRDGDVFIGNQGNHRLAMAQVLGLDEIAGGIVCRWTP